jgi:regulation of enolase protein 1 (concanavalin A-like superfamily)
MATTSALRNAAVTGLWSLGLMASLCPVHGATLGLVDGRELKGRVELRPSQQIALQPAAGLAESFAWAQAAQINFQGDRVPEAPWLTNVEPATANNTLPPGWQAVDIGRNPQAGMAQYRVENAGKPEVMGVFQFQTAALGLLPQSDSLQMIQRSLGPRGDVTAKLISVHQVGLRSMAGLCIRADTSADCAMASLVVNEAGNGVLTCRERKGAPAKPRAVGRISPMTWLRLERQQDDVIAFTSRNGRDWEYTAAVTVSLPENVLAGAIAASTKETKPASSRLAFLTVRPLETSHRLLLRDGTLLAGQITSVAEGQVRFLYRNRDWALSLNEVARLQYQTLTAAIAERLRPGKPGLMLRRGEFWEGQVTRVDSDKVWFKGSGNGRELRINRDGGVVVLQEVQPARALVELTTLREEVLFGQNLVWNDGQVRIDIPELGTVTVPANEVVTLRRLGDLSPAGATTAQPGPAVAGGRVIRLDGTPLTGAIKLAEGRVQISQGNNPTVSLALEEIRELVLVPTTGPAETGTPVNAQWKGTDLHRGRRGAFASQENRLWVEAAGRQVGSQADSFYLLHLPLNGSGQIIARLSRLDGATEQTRVGLMMREKLEPGTRHYFVGVAPGKGIAYLRRNGQGANTEQQYQSKASLPVWLRLNREERTFTASYSTDGRKWTDLGSGQTELSNETLVGLAVASGSEQTLCRAEFDQVSVVRHDAVAFQPRLVLRSGSELTGTVLSADDVVLRFQWRTREPVSLSLNNVARLVFQPLPPAVANTLNPATQGLLLRTGDFLKGDFAGVENKEISLASELFGLRRFRFPDQVAALWLRAPEPPANAWQLRLVEGSLLQGRNLKVEGNRISLEEPVLGRLEFAPGEIASLRRAPRTEAR